MFESNEDLVRMVKPYRFALREGKKIEENYLDYSLVMLRTGAPEMLKSRDSVDYLMLPATTPETFRGKRNNPAFSGEPSNSSSPSI